MPAPLNRPDRADTSEQVQAEPQAEDDIAVDLAAVVMAGAWQADRAEEDGVGALACVVGAVRHGDAGLHPACRPGIMLVEVQSGDSAQPGRVGQGFPGDPGHFWPDAVARHYGNEVLAHRRPAERAAPAVSPGPGGGSAGMSGRPNTRVALPPRMAVSSFGESSSAVSFTSSVAMLLMWSLPNITRSAPRCLTMMPMAKPGDHDGSRRTFGQRSATSIASRQNAPNPAWHSTTGTSLYLCAMGSARCGSVWAPPEPGMNHHRPLVLARSQEYFVAKVVIRRDLVAKGMQLKRHESVPGQQELGAHLELPPLEPGVEQRDAEYARGRDRVSLAISRCVSRACGSVGCGITRHADRR